jgi:hypothetical protein
MQQALADLDDAIDDAGSIVGERPPSVAAAREELASLEAKLKCEMRYVHRPDWELKPGRLITRKGTWLKRSTAFSWEIPQKEKMYVPEGVGLPILQIGPVTDQVELKRHEWSAQHALVWMKPPIIEKLEARRDVWFVYWPHWESNFKGKGSVIASSVDTWLKRTTGMSGEMQPFELIYVPKGMIVNLARDPEEVDEEWELKRHGHVHQHRKVILSSHPKCIRRDQFDIFVEQAE